MAPDCTPSTAPRHGAGRHGAIRHTCTPRAPAPPHLHPPLPLEQASRVRAAARTPAAPRPAAPALHGPLPGSRTPRVYMACAAPARNTCRALAPLTAYLHAPAFLRCTPWLRPAWAARGSRCTPVRVAWARPFSPFARPLQSSAAHRPLAHQRCACVPSRPAAGAATHPLAASRAWVCGAHCHARGANHMSAIPRGILPCPTQAVLFCNLVMCRRWRHRRTAPSTTAARSTRAAAAAAAARRRSLPGARLHWRSSSCCARSPSADCAAAARGKRSRTLAFLSGVAGVCELQRPVCVRQVCGL
ncbi:MAG: hypothetical protein J3K34DRAFT_33270 [Monoraphidium minutum]|nr:MAG: hypothetical protein J3K34DRAFT_33270 [Monoraphidium minutum]